MLARPAYWAALCGMVAWAGLAEAGGGPQNLLLVVNQRSWASKTIANHYMALRSIPTSNIVYLDWPDDVIKQVPVDTFRKRILGPTLAMIERRGLQDQIDYIVYSADFPYAVALRSDTQGQQHPKFATGVGAINGLTYLGRLVMRKDTRYLKMRINNYARRSGNATGWKSHGFRSWYGWSEEGELLDAGGEHYWLSMMLAATTGRGNSVAEAIACLKRSVAADGTRPQGTFYFASSNDPRSKARAPAFDATVKMLQALGARGEIIRGTFPRGRDDILGLTLGTPNVPLKQSGSTILPGAICDNLTSYGGALEERTNQTPLTDFLRFGAAAASGTVVEPYLIPAKFPFPFLHVHYVRGCSLAESFYQSVAGPYQLLIVGDPLCRPWAFRPKISVEGADLTKPLQGVVTLKPTADWSGQRQTGGFELFVDGQRRTSCKPGETLRLDTRSLVDGYHELRVVATEDDPVESQGEVRFSIHTNNYGREIRFSIEPQTPTIGSDESLRLTADAPGAEQIAFFQASRLLGTVRGQSGTLTVRCEKLGHGPVLLRAVGIVQNDPRKVVVADPRRVEVVPAAPLKRLDRPIWKDLEPGFLVQNRKGKTVAVEQSHQENWLEVAGVGRNEPYRVTGYFFVPKAEVYQFQIRPSGRAILRVDDRQIADVANPAKSFDIHYVTVNLEDGLHRFEIHGQTNDRPRLQVRFGGAGARRIGKATCRHAPL